VPITVLTPLTPQVSPGVELILRTDLSGPIGTDWVWRVTINPHGSETVTPIVMLAPIWSVDQHEVQMTITPQSSGQFGTFYSNLATLITGELVDVVATLQTSTGVAVDTGAATSWRWDTNGSSSLRVPAATGAFTAEDRAALSAVLAGLTVTVPAIGQAGGVIQTALGSLWSDWPPNQTNRHGSILVSGQGSLARGTEPFRVDALGFEWHWHTIPPGFGFTIGDPAEYGRRIAQWREIQQDSSGQLYQSNVIDASYEGVRRVWGVHQPVTLEWFISPGCVVELSFLVAALG
jgi:hypothetical protein